jgi:hypothetical protein
VPKDSGADLSDLQEALVAKKAKRKSSVAEVHSDAGEPAIAGLTLCERYIVDNPEVLSGFSLTIDGSESANLRVSSCRGPVRVRVTLDRETGGAPRLIADASEVTDVWRDISLQAFASLAPGQNYVLIWVIDGPADDWQVVSELSLNQTVHYRHLKKHRPGVINGEVLMIKVRAA